MATLLAGVMTAGLGAPAMASSGWLRLAPTTVTQGQTLSITARCTGSGRSVTASSSAFSQDAKLTRDRLGIYSGAATISSTARLGTHVVTVHCVQSGSLPSTPRGSTTVVSSSSGRSTATTGGTSTWVWNGSQWVLLPSGGVPAGGGSMAAGFGSGPLTAAGLVLVLLGMLASVLLWQRRPSARRG